MQYPLLSSKREDFEMFAAIVQLMYKREHLEEEGFAQVVQLAEQLNKSGKKKYVRSQIKV